MAGTVLTACDAGLSLPPVDGGDGLVDGGGDGQDVPASSKFEMPQQCGACHPKHFEEWQGSVMHYAAESPVFNAFELTFQKLTDGLFAADGEHANLCINCHSPTGVFGRELPEFPGADSAVAAREHLTPVSREGLSCDFCHTVVGPDLEASMLGDGIANVSLLMSPGETKFGPLEGPMESSYHQSATMPFISSAEFCGGCHDVRLPFPDKRTGEPFQRLENLFTEWQEGPYNSTDNPHGKVVTCQDCHMSLYPIEAPGTYPTMQVAEGEMPERRHAIHAFTAVSFPFIDDDRFPNVTNDELDIFGFPKGQIQRREQMLRAACRLTLDETPDVVNAESTVIPVRVTVENVGAGHRVPSGFSQERQVWIELVVQDDGGVIYQSGYLRDKAHPETGENEPDGRLHDEDLEDRHFEIDLETLDSHVHPGPDINQRPAVNLGLVNFQNAFQRQHEDGTWEDIVNPLLADTMDNSRSLDMLTPRTFQYDVPVPTRGIQGEITVTARLRYRAFPPELLRILAMREPELVNEDIVDRNTIVDMANDAVTVRVE